MAKMYFTKKVYFGSLVIKGCLIQQKTVFHNNQCISLSKLFLINAASAPVLFQLVGEDLL